MIKGKTICSPCIDLSLYDHVYKMKLDDLQKENKNLEQELQIERNRLQELESEKWEKATCNKCRERDQKDCSIQ